MHADIQIMFTPYVELEVVQGLPQPGVIVVVVGDILVNGKVEEAFRQTKMDLLQKPTPEEIKKKAVQFQVEIEPSLWKNINVN